MDKAKAQELITQLERHQQGQLECLQSLLGITREDKAGEGPQKDLAAVQGNRSHASDAKSSSDSPAQQTSASNGPTQERLSKFLKNGQCLGTNALLAQRLDERSKEPGCGGGLRRELGDVDPTDPAVRFIVKNALKDLAHFSLENEAQDVEIPFYVVDFDASGKRTLDTRDYSKLPAVASEKISKRDEVLRSLFSQRTSEMSVERTLVINAYTPSALSTVLLCAAKNEDRDYTTIFAALRRHLSTTIADRHFNEGHGMRLQPQGDGPTYRHITAFTVPYFRLTNTSPAANGAPLASSGLFGNDVKGSLKYIREEKFTVSWSGGLGPDQPSLMVALSPLAKYWEREQGRFSGLTWIRNNFFHIVHEWDQVLDSLDEQTSLSSSITFSNEARMKLLFEDRKFTNSKRYFWALQSLRLFKEHIEGTIRSIPNIFISSANIHGSEDRKIARQIADNYVEQFRKLRDRIERKQQEIQSLSDSLFSASSVAEGRLAAEQSGNIRLLTMITIAYLPLSLATSIYGMDALPQSAGLVSYIVVTLLMCLVTYLLVFNLQRIKDTASWAHGGMRGRLRAWRSTDRGQERKVMKGAKAAWSPGDRANMMA